MPESSRNKTIEVMARAAYAENDWWRTPADDDDGKGRYQEMNGVTMRAVEWDELDAVDRDSRLKEMAAAFTAYESHLEASGMAVVPVSLLDDVKCQLWWDDAGNTEALRDRIDAVLDGKAERSEGSAEGEARSTHNHPQEKDA